MGGDMRAPKKNIMQIKSKLIKQTLSSSSSLERKNLTCRLLKVGKRQRNKNITIEILRRNSMKITLTKKKLLDSIMNNKCILQRLIYVIL